MGVAQKSTVSTIYSGVDLGVSATTDKSIREHILCLLYTSPSPRDATLSRMPSSA